MYVGGKNLLAMQTGLPAALLADDVYEIIQANAARFDAAIDYKRDYE